MIVNHGGKRSLPGEGEPVDIYLYGDEDMGEVGGKDMSAGIWKSDGEDFADCSFPIVIKVRKGVTRDQLLNGLAELSKAVANEEYPGDSL